MHTDILRLQSIDTRTLQPSEAYIRVAETLHMLKKLGVGEPTKEYPESEYADWMTSSFPDSDNVVVQEHNQMVKEVLHRVALLSEKYLSSHPRDNGPTDKEEDKNLSAHGRRSTQIVVSEFGIEDPITLTTTYLHDVYRYIHTDDQRKAFEKDFREAFSAEKDSASSLILQKLEKTHFVDRALQAMQNTHELDRKYARISKLVAEHFDGVIEKFLSGDITPATYETFRQDVISQFVGSGEDQYPDIETLMNFCTFGVLEGHEVTASSSGFPEMIALMAEAVDNGRYIRGPRNGESYTIEDRKAQTRDLLNGIFNLLPLARVLELQTAVNPLSESAAKVLFPQQWQAMQKNLDARAQEREKGSFKVQLRANEMLVRNFIAKEAKGRNVPAVEVSQIEFEYRKFLMLGGVWPANKPILGDHEYCLLFDIKTPGSMFSKWLKVARTGQLDDARWLGNDVEVKNMSKEEKQKKLMERFADKSVWATFTPAFPDILRCTVVVGNSLGAEFAAPASVPLDTPQRESVYEQIQKQMVFVDEVPTAEQLENGRILLNHAVSIKANVPQQRKEGLEWRVPAQYDEEGDLNYEFHANLLKNEMTGGKHNQVLEVHVETAKKHFDNVFGKDSHVITYKLKDILNGTNRIDEVMWQHKFVWYAFQFLVFNGALAPEHTEHPHPESRTNEELQTEALTATS
jgi:hypothetical protein